jgi:ferrous iron transport protein A
MPALPLLDPRPLPTESPVLSSLAPGERGVVSSLDAEPRLAERLCDLGFVPGTPVQVVRRSPLGDPTEYEIRGYRICLRRSEGERIRVQRA